VDGACRNQTEVPDSPPDRTLPKASGAKTGTPVIEIVGANRFPVEQPLTVSIAAVDATVTHRPPLLGIEAQDMRNLVEAVRPFNSGCLQPGEPYNRERTNVVVLLSNPAQVPAWALQRQWINPKK
jgi:hypothetical protein